MKIAILLAGHLRTWELCRNNFLENLYDSDHQIDVFIDTYDQVYRTDYMVHKEKENTRIIDRCELNKMFVDINVVYSNFEPEKTGNAEPNQIRKLLNVFDNFVIYESSHEVYDLVIKSRFDIKILSRLNFEQINDECVKNSNLLLISKGGVNSHPLENDMFAIGNSSIIKLYYNRFREFSTNTHLSLGDLRRKYNLLVKNSIDISIVRPSF